MGLDTHMIAGSRACTISTRLTHPIITNQTTPHFAETLAATLRLTGLQGLGAVARKREPL
jgi:hypothetical protein